MDILKCYRILELDQNATLLEVRKAYIDMVRVWHPDRFLNNPRLRKKAEEKLKEMNIAYAELRGYIPRRQETLQTEHAAERARGAMEPPRKGTSPAKQVAFQVFAFVSAVFRKADFKRVIRGVLWPDRTFQGVPYQKNQAHSGISGRTGRTGKYQNRHRKFLDIYEELARAKKEEKKKIGVVG